MPCPYQRNDSVNLYPAPFLPLSGLSNLPVTKVLMNYGKYPEFPFGNAMITNISSARMMI